MKIKANRVADFEACKAAGDFYITEPNPAENGMMRLSFLCPCGCGELCGIRIRSDGKENGAAWGWNLDGVNPTCTPSIEVKPAHWHGYLKNGFFTTEGA